MSPPSDLRLICPALNFTPPQTPPALFAAEIAYFTSIPWTAALLAAAGTIPFIPPCRNTLTDVHDQLFGVTLANDRCFAHLLSSFRAESHAAALDPQKPILTTTHFIAVGDGVSGYPSVVHGGMTGAMMDEAMGATFELNGVLGKDFPTFKTGNMTARLDVTYLKPVYTNTIVCIVARIEEMNGRKTRVACEMKDEKGAVLAKCSSNWISLKASL
ncbi:hypothetical protein G7046_g3464 [Stylonectria norvegica]|nr:hypothetical protein G7046_g3464 [Stylonectria norvegica]